MATRVKALSTTLERLSSEFISSPIRRCTINVYQHVKSKGDEDIVVNRYAASMGLVHETNIARELRHEDICKFSGDGLELSIIVDALTAGIVHPIYVHGYRIRINKLAETNPKYCECLSTLFDISPPFAILDDEQDMFVHLQSTPQVEYDTWLHSPSSCIITTYGHRGIGKGFNARVLFRKLKESSLCTTYFSFSSSDIRRSSAVALLSSITFQILNQDPARFPRIESLYAAMKNSEAWTQAGLLVLFQSLMDTKGLDPLYLIIDGLHKCDSSRQVLLDTLLAIFSNDRLPMKLKVAVFYQERQDIQLAMDKFGKFRLDGPILKKDSLKLFVEVITDNPYLLPLEPQISEALEKCKDSTELWLALHSLGSSNGTPRSLKSVRALTMTLPPQVADVVSTRFKALRGWARLSLGWISHAKRPLRLNELATAVALTDDKGNFAVPFDPHSLPLDIVAEIKSAFGPLLRVEVGNVLFSTEDIRDCFLRLIAKERQISGVNPGVKGPDNSSETIIPDHAHITRILLKYLSRAEFIDQIDKNLREEEYIRPRRPLFDLTAYAVQFWPVHYQAAEEVCPTTDNVLELFQDRRMVRVWYELNSKVNCAPSPPDLCVMDPLLLAAQLGLVSIVKKSEKDLKGVNRNVAISLASWGGHADVVELLLCNADKADTSNLSEALSYASGRGYDQIVERLLEHMKSIQYLSSSQLDELICQAAQLGYERQVSLFFKYGAKVDAVPDGIAPLQHAAQNGHASVVHFLLKEAGADVNSKLKEDSDAPIVLATRGGYQVVVEHLLAFHADLPGRNDGLRKSTPLHLAANNGHDGIVRLLIDYCAAAEDGQLTDKTKISPPVSVDIDSDKSSIINVKDENGKSPLILACAKGHKEVVKLLLERGADVTLQDDDDHTALYYATSLGSGSLAEAILNHVNVVDTFKDIGAVFLRAAECGFTNIVRQCLDSTTQVNNVALRDYNNDDSRTALHYAAESGHKDIVSLLLAAKAQVDKEDSEGCTPLTLAAVAGETDIVKDLLTKGANVLQKNSNGQTIVTQVASNPERSAGHANVINILLEKGVDPNAIDNFGQTALLFAALVGNPEIVESLLQYKADLKLKARDLENPLHYAARSRSGSAKRIAKRLIQAGIDPLEGDEDDWIPLHFASRWGNVETLKLLWKKAPNSVDARANDGRTVVHFGYDEPKVLEWLLKQEVTVDDINNDGETALMLAAYSGIEDSIRVLLDNHADLTIRDKIKRTALHHAANYGNVETGRMLLKKNPNILCYRDKRNLSALHFAIREGAAEFAEMLLDEYYSEASLEDLNTVDENDGETPLISAVSKNQEKVIEKLLKLGVDTEVRNKVGNTALLVAVDNSTVSILNILLKSINNHADINAGGCVHPTALHAAAEDGSFALVQELIILGAEVNAEGGTFNTALSAAAVGGFDDVADLLLEKGADPKMSAGIFSNTLSAALFSPPFGLVPTFIKAGADVNAMDSQGRTSMHISARQGSEMIEVLQAAGGDPTIKDKQGRTLFHFAATSGDAWLIEDEKLRDLNVEDADGWTPLHWACRDDENMEIAKFLIKHGADVVKATADGWTPENIAVFHDAVEIVDLIKEKAAERNDSTTSNGTSQSNQATSSEPELEQTSKRKNWKIGEHHYNIYCDGCFQNTIIGVRWHCKKCRNINFCFKCYWHAKETHPGHEFERLPEKGGDTERNPELEDEGESDRQEESDDEESSDEESDD